MVNCANAACNLHVTICPPCGVLLDGACKVACQQHPAKRPYNADGYYGKTLNGYDPIVGYSTVLKPKIRVKKGIQLHAQTPVEIHTD